MTLRIKEIYFILPLAFVLGGCPDGGPETGVKVDPTGNDSNDSGTDTTDSGGDSNGGDPETGVAILATYGHFLTAAGTLTGGEMGLTAITANTLTGRYTDLDVICKVAGAVHEGAPAPCESCDWAFNVVVANSTVSGSDCSDIPWVDGEVDGFGVPLGWADRYERNGYAYEDVLFYYFPSPYYYWGTIAFTVGGNAYGGYTYGTAEDATFYLPSSYYYYYTYP